MNKKKTHRAKSKVKRQTILERSGDWIVTNHWIQVGLTRAQVKLLTNLGKTWSLSKRPCAGMARHLIALALLDLEGTNARLRKLAQYLDAEGFNSLGLYCEGAMRPPRKA